MEFMTYILVTIGIVAVYSMTYGIVNRICESLEKREATKAYIAYLTSDTKGKMDIKTFNNQRE